jgi:hypothetical protein
MVAQGYDRRCHSAWLLPRLKNERKGFMKSGMTSFKLLAGWLTAGIFALGMAVPTLAQGGPPPGMGQPTSVNPKLDDINKRNEQSRLRTGELEASAEKENQKRIQAAIVNMKQDFTRIQVLRNDIARDLVAHKPLNYGLLTEQTAEINKRAHRLTEYMFARAAENKEPDNPVDLKGEEIIGSLVKLCKLIDSFTENPALKNAATIDAKQNENAKKEKARADSDLLAIIKLSHSIQKKAESVKAQQ